MRDWKHDLKKTGTEYLKGRAVTQIVNDNISLITVIHHDELITQPQGYGIELKDVLDVFFPFSFRHIQQRLVNRSID